MILKNPISIKRIKLPFHPFDLFTSYPVIGYTYPGAGNVLSFHRSLKTLLYTYLKVINMNRDKIEDQWKYRREKIGSPFGKNDE